MHTLDLIKIRLIDKISSSKNERLLAAIDKLFDSTRGQEDRISLSLSQIEILKMSDMDIENGNLISESEL